MTYHGYACDPVGQIVDHFSNVGFSTTGPFLRCDVSGGDLNHQTLVSSSNTDPDVHTGPITDDSLYLWCWTNASSGYGFHGDFTAFEGDIQVVGFEGSSGHLEWDYGHWVLVWGVRCRSGYSLVGRLILQLPVAVEPETWGRMKALYR
ncbi:MAG: hypothetical protein U0167_13475 [bacterium]